jgi:ribose transport system substrate-binding protein
MRGVVAGVCLVVAACGGQADHAPAVTIGVTLLTKEHEFYRQLESGLEEGAAKHGYRLVVTSGDFDLAKQQSEIDNFVVQHVSAMIVCPVDSRGIGPAIARATAAGVPVFTADIRAAGVPVIAHVGSDNIEGGRIAAVYMARVLGDSGAVAVIGQPETQTGLDRQTAFVAEIGRHPRMHVVAIVGAGGVRDRALTVAEDVLQGHPELRGIFAINDETALGTLSAAKSHGKTADNFAIVGYDATPEAVAAIRAHTALRADVAQSPRLMGAETIDVIAHFLSQPATRLADSVITVPVSIVE